MTPNEVALYEKYLMARAWFEKAVDGKHAAIAEAARWEELANYRKRVTWYASALTLVAGWVIGRYL